ncbi:hypothetical protein [Peptoniphilus timonensis]|uniref:hypothetical protein n=1 Tax=Peptoniphilus timonensis TaxID=1268254 RepID=UPI0005934B58|nr:hypothetical protein [Peptoniphilus timonensis]
MSKNKNKLRRTLALTASVAIMGTSIPFNVLANGELEKAVTKEIVANNNATSIKEDAPGENEKLEMSEEKPEEAVKAISDDPRYALFNDVPESVLEGGVDLATDEEKAQGKFNRITSVKVAKDPNNKNQNDYVLKIEGETNTTSDTMFYIMPKIRYFDINKEELKDLKTEEEILNKIKLTESKISYNPNYKNWIVDSIRASLKGQEDNEEIGWVKSQRVSIENVSDNVKSIRYSVIMDIQHTESDLYTKKTGEKLPLDINAKNSNGLIQIGKANVPVLNAKVEQDEPIVTFNKGKTTEGSVKVNNVDDLKIYSDINKTYELISENKTFILNPNQFILLATIPFSNNYIEGENPLEYNFILNKENFSFDNDSEFAKINEKEAISDNGVIVKTTTKNNFIIKYKSREIVENSNLLIHIFLKLIKIK